MRLDLALLSALTVGVVATARNQGPWAAARSPDRAPGWRLGKPRCNVLRFSRPGRDKVLRTGVASPSRGLATARLRGIYGCEAGPHPHHPMTDPIGMAPDTSAASMLACEGQTTRASRGANPSDSASGPARGNGRRSTGHSRRIRRRRRAITVTLLPPHPISCKVDA